MTHPPARLRPREIINRTELYEALQDAVVSLPPAERANPGACQRIDAILLAAFGKGCRILRARLEAGGALGPGLARQQAFLIDQILRALLDVAVKEIFPRPLDPGGMGLALIAIGGYGRAELAPYSDIDLLFLYDGKPAPHHQGLIEFLLYRLWNLGLKLGHFAGNSADALALAKEDLVFRTALLDMRFVYGDQALALHLQQGYEAELLSGPKAAFIAAKLQERDLRHEKLGDSRYILEPNIKEGKGGLRDLQALYWIAQYVYGAGESAALFQKGILSHDEAIAFDKARDFLWTLRFWMHHLSGRAEDRLTFDLQRDISARMGYTNHAGTKGIERLMKHYYLIAKTVGDLTRILCAALESMHGAKPVPPRPELRWQEKELMGFSIEGGRLSIADPQQFQNQPLDMVRLFSLAQRLEIDIHPFALRSVRRSLRKIDRKLRENPDTGHLFLDILSSPKDPELALRRMSEAGVLGRLIPDFGRIVAQMQYDMYHHYTVDEHSLRAIGILHRIETGQLKEMAPVASGVIHQIQSRRVLYLAVFLHDIAKGRGGDHSEIGAEIAAMLGPRMGLSSEETETLTWLVRHHLLLSNTAFRRDMDDPETVPRFAGEVQSLERLRLLLALTVADIAAVSPKAWTGWKAALLRELYWRAEEYLSGGLTAASRQKVANAIAVLEEQLRDWPQDELNAYPARSHSAYWLAFDAAAHLRHAELIRKIQRDPTLAYALDIHTDLARSTSEITIYTRDRIGLFACIAGILAAIQTNIVEARIFTFANGMALDSFSIQMIDGRSGLDARQTSKLHALLASFLGDAEPLDLERIAQQIPKIPSSRRWSAFPIAPRVLIDNQLSATHTVIELNGRDRPGLLFAIARTLTRLQLQTGSAKIATYGERAVDVFYVKDRFGLKVEKEARLLNIRAALLQALQEPAAKQRRAAG